MGVKRVDGVVDMGISSCRDRCCHAGALQNGVTDAVGVVYAFGFWSLSGLSDESGCFDSDFFDADGFGRPNIFIIPSMEDVPDIISGIRLGNSMPISSHFPNC